MKQTDLGFSITIDAKEFVASMEKSINRNPRPLLKRFQVLMIRSFDLNFRHEGRPQRWALLKKATMRRKKSKGILKDTGRLRLSLSGERQRGNITRFRRDSLLMGTSVPYAGYLQHGTKHMPARPFVVIQDEDAQEMERLTLDFLLETW